MKLRNKKTGEVGEAYWSTFRSDGDELYISLHKNGTFVKVNSLAELNEEWEDYAPKGPYIGDEATAQFVRAWAKHWGIERVMARARISHGVDLIGWVDDSLGREIDIQAAFVSGEIKDGGYYTIDELCGEGEG